MHSNVQFIAYYWIWVDDQWKSAKWNFLSRKLVPEFSNHILFCTLSLNMLLCSLCIQDNTWAGSGYLNDSIFCTKSERKRTKNSSEPHLFLNIYLTCEVVENVLGMNMLHILCSFIVTHIAIFIGNSYTA